MVASEVNGREVTVAYDELVAGFEQFARDVHTFLLREVPEVAQHPSWPSWFPASLG